jgi:hypothetical protein
MAGRRHRERTRAGYAGDPRAANRNGALSPLDSFQLLAAYPDVEL